MTPTIPDHRIRSARNILHSHGVEATEEEAEAEIRSIYTTLRDKMRSRGHVVPDDPEEFRLWMIRALHK